MIHNKRFTLKIKQKEGNKLLDTINSFFKKKMNKKSSVLRWAIVDVKQNNLIIDATILKK